ncbi:MAG: hypothetical protein H0U79_05070, partial [Solirubrobacterales bacterium]|nr:hypothetical protein [Solirubrobacterales bacterium]
MLERQTFPEAAQVLAVVDRHRAQRKAGRVSEQPAEDTNRKQRPSAESRDEARARQHGCVRSVAVVLARLITFGIEAIAPLPVTVEVDLRTGLPAFTIVGRGDASVRESRERVHAAILNAGFAFPARRVTVNLAPAHVRKIGPGFDLAIACGVLAASAQVPAEALARWAVFGEVSLGGELRPCRGALAVAEGARRAGLPGLI